MPDFTPRIEQQSAPEGALMRVMGQWTAAQFARSGLLRRLEASLPQAAAQAGWDLRQAEQLDHIGAQWLWDHWGRQWPGRLELLPAQQAVLDRVAQLHGAAARAQAHQLAAQFREPGRGGDAGGGGDPLVHRS